MPAAVHRATHQGATLLLGCFCDANPPDVEHPLGDDRPLPAVSEQTLRDVLGGAGWDIASIEPSTRTREQNGTEIEMAFWLGWCMHSGARQPEPEPEPEIEPGESRRQSGLHPRSHRRRAAGGRGDAGLALGDSSGQRARLSDVDASLPMRRGTRFFASRR